MCFVNSQNVRDLRQPPALLEPEGRAPVAVCQLVEPGETLPEDVQAGRRASEGTRHDEHVAGTSPGPSCRESRYSQMTGES